MTAKNLISLFGYVHGINLLVIDREISLWAKNTQSWKRFGTERFSKFQCP